MFKFGGANIFGEPTAVVGTGQKKSVGRWQNSLLCRSQNSKKKLKLLS